MSKDIASKKSGGDLDKIKTLRGITGAGLMNCKEALKLKNGDLDEAVQYLKEKGLAIANIESYIHHNSRIGVLVEINCETDFVAQTDELKAFAKEIALQVAASDSLRYVNREDLTEEQLNSLKSELGSDDSEKVVNEKLKESDSKVKNFMDSTLKIEKIFWRLVWIRVRLKSKGISFVK